MRRDELKLPDPPLVRRPCDAFVCDRQDPDGSGSSPCAVGPDHRGRCPLAGHDDTQACVPQRTWRSKRRRLMLKVSLALLVVCGLALGTPWAPRVIRPGELSKAHSQILSGTLQKDRCAACHANVSTETWTKQFGWAVSMASSSGGDAAGSMTDRCLVCHHRAFGGDVQARSAHNLSLAELEQAHQRWMNQSEVPLQTVSLPRKWMAQALIDSSNLECNACHQEHHGQAADLKAITDARCQACHKTQFHSFANGHPEFTDWPSVTNRRIRFDHNRHAKLHYPKQSGAPVFDCQQCHFDPRVGSQGEPIIASRPYEEACASCHDAGLDAISGEGIAIWQLPTISQQSAARLESWPPAAIGFPDEQVSALTSLLVSSSVTAPLSRKAVDETAGPLRDQLIQLALGGQRVLQDRLMSLGMGAQQADVFAASLPPQLLVEAALKWFDVREPVAPATDFTDPTNVLFGGDSESLLSGNGGELLGSAGSGDLLSGGTDPLGTDALALDPLAANPSAESSTDRSGESDWANQLRQRYAPESTQPLGGWYRDDVIGTITYRSSGHADPILVALIETMLDQRSQGAWAALAELPAVKACVECHTLGMGSNSESHLGWASRWRTTEVRLGVRSLTRFSHRPHWNISVLRDCRQCHAMTGEVVPESGDKAPVVTVEVHADFHALSKSACVTCHHPDGAGDSCTQCHQYHASPIRLDLDVTEVARRARGNTLE
ncbi:MAG: hypothetical protein AAGD07_04035 [Planctomycetota bacterium]